MYSVIDFTEVAYSLMTHFEICGNHTKEKSDVDIIGFVLRIQYFN